MPQDITAIQREKINREARAGLICTNGMGERTVNGKASASDTPKANLVFEQKGHKQAVPSEDSARD